MVRTYMAASGYKERGKLLSILSCHDTCWILMLIIKEEWGRDRFGGSVHGRGDAFLLGGQQGELGTIESWRAFAHRRLGYVARFFNILKRSQTSGFLCEISWFLNISGWLKYKKSVGQIKPICLKTCRLTVCFLWSERIAFVSFLDLFLIKQQILIDEYNV